MRFEFIKNLSSWVSSLNLSRIILLGSSFAECLATSLSSEDVFPLRYYSVNEPVQNQIKLQNLGWKAVESVDPFTLVPNDDGIIRLPGSGLTKSLMKSFQDLKIPTTAIILYCSEGDNRPHAFHLANQINKLLEIFDFKTKLNWTKPFSWRNMFGTEAPLDIF